MDEQFRHRLETHEPGALKELLDVYRDTVYLATYRLTANKSDALMLTRKVFQTIIMAIPYLSKVKSLDIFVYRIILKCVSDYTRARNKSGLFQRIYSLFTKPKPEQLEDLSPEEVRDKVLTALGSLSLGHQALIISKYYLQRDTKEAAVLLDTSERMITRGTHQAQSRLLSLLKRSITCPKEL